MGGGHFVRPSGSCDAGNRRATLLDAIDERFDYGPNWRGATKKALADDLASRGISQRNGRSRPPALALRALALLLAVAAAVAIGLACWTALTGGR